MNTEATRSKSKRFKFPKRYTPFVFAFYMSSMMGILMCSTVVAVSTGFTAGYVVRVLKAYALAMPVAFCCVLMLKPLIVRLVEATVER